MFTLDWLPCQDTSGLESTEPVHVLVVIHHRQPPKIVRERDNGKNLVLVGYLASC